jgi:hypothetical protein
MAVPSSSSPPREDGGPAPPNPVTKTEEGGEKNRAEFRRVA